MGREQRQRPKYMAKKLRTIRNKLALSQNELIARMDLTAELYQDYISAYERGIREPPLPVLLRYAKLAGVCADVLIDDTLKLPEKLPGRPRHSAKTKARKSR
jgi:transcriptional regulator with XRE-family HTH domain